MLRSAAVLSLLFASPAIVGCGAWQRDTVKHAVRIESEPSGAWVSRLDAKGKQNLGQAPLDVEVETYEERYHSSPGIWIGPALFGIATGIMLPVALTTDDKILPGVLGGLSISTGLGFLLALPVAISLALQDGEVTARGYQGVPPAFEGTLSGYSSASSVLQNGEEPPTEPIVLRLAPSGGSPLIGSLSSEGGIVGAPTKRPVMAVFGVEDRSHQIKEESLDQLTDYVVARVTEAGRFRVVPRSELRARLTDTKAEAFRACVDESCQIELGKAVAAAKSLATRIIRAGGSCAMTMTLYDLTTEASESAATVRTECAERALMDGIDQLTTRLSQ